VANLSNRGNSPINLSELSSRTLTLFDWNASWQKSESPIRGSGALVQHKTLSNVMFMVGRKWFPFKFPTCGSQACVLFDVGTSQCKTNGIWAHSVWEPGDQTPTCGPAYLCLVRWLEDVPASFHEAGNMVDGVRQPWAVAILLSILVPIAVSGFRSIRSLQLVHQDGQRVLPDPALGVLHESYGCFCFRPGLLVLHLQDE